MIFRSHLTAFFAAIILLFGAVTAHAQTTIASDGTMNIRGEITGTGLNSFTIQSHEGTMNVTLARLNDRSLQSLKSAGIIKIGNIVDVTGRLEQSAIRSSIAADTVSIYSPDPIPEPTQ